MVLINGKPENRINISDRGLQYGDGVFETLAYRQQHLELWPEHQARLMLGCQRLKIPFTQSQADQLEAELHQVIASLDQDAVIKIIVTRGEGGRGYRPDPLAQPTRIISTHALPSYPDNYQQGISVRVCEQTLSENATLAGVKHLNRLEQVLARAEWENNDIPEGLMLNAMKQVIEGTMSNLFLVINGCLITPELSHAGVAGVMRGVVLEIAEALGIPVQQRIVEQSELLLADELFVTNSIVKIWPIVQIDGMSHHFSHGSLTKTLQQQLARRLTGE